MRPGGPPQDIRAALTRSQGALLLAVFVAAAALRIYLLPFPASYDLALIKQFSIRLAEIGPRDYYLADYDHYLPGYLYVLWGIGELRQAFFSGISDSSYSIVLKLPANIFDFATALLIFEILRKRISANLAMLGPALYLFNPAIFYNSAVWGQFEAAQAFLCLAAVYFLLEQKPEVATVSMSLAILVKAQAIGLAPIFALALLMWTPPKRVLLSATLALVVVFLVQLPFFTRDPFFGMISLTRETMDNYPFTFQNAFNFWGMFGGWPRSLTQDQSTFLVFNKQTWGFLLWLTAQIGSGLWLYRHRSDRFAVYWACSLALFAFFVLPTRIHERYLFPFFSFFIIAVLLSRGWVALISVYASISVLHFLNLYYVQQPKPYPILEPFFDFALSHQVAMSCLLVSFFALLVAVSAIPYFFRSPRDRPESLTATGRV